MRVSIDREQASNCSDFTTFRHEMNKLTHVTTIPAILVQQLHTQVINELKLCSYKGLLILNSFVQNISCCSRVVVASGRQAATANKSSYL